MRISDWSSDVCSSDLTVTTTLAVFQIAQPNTIDITDPGGGLPTLALNGEVRTRGIELNAYGEITHGARLMGGLTLNDRQQPKTQDGLSPDERRVGNKCIPSCRSRRSTTTPKNK